jgi:hypothetical protein
MASHTRTLLPLPLLGIAIGVAGCGLMVQQFVGRPSTSVSMANPLLGGGGTLVAQAPAKNHMIRSYAQPSTCDHWPVGDQYALDVTAEQICVTVRWVGDVAPEEKAATISLASGARSIEVPVTPDPSVDRIAKCEAQSVSGGVVDAWVRAFHGCVPNDGLITTESEKLTVDGDVTWALTR